ncbi:NmrA family NAD(P)-binding protein [Pseudogracilibacillus sp. SO30301A]|uniref:NmrA family NAD(P)-binding protein n=1 Tax=Pseudogracilibacillus sp. SO30301A TaxID=3098291 RepID=UPI00300DD121
MIVVTTPTGQIGHQVLNNILDSGEEIRVIARDPSRLSPHVRERVEVVQGSHGDIDVVTEAFAGADCVFWLVPPNPHVDNIKSYYLDLTRPMCETIKSQGVKRVVDVTTLGHGYVKEAGHLSAGFAVDDLIESTGVNYRALRMPFFMDNLLQQVETIKSQGMFFLPNFADRTLATVATSDIATVAAKFLLDDSWSGQESVPVIGPDNLTPTDMAQIMSKVLQRPICFHQVSYADYKATMLQYGVSNAWAQGLIDMAAAQNDGIYDAEQRATQSTTPTSFRQWCENVLRPAVLA